MKIAVEGCAHGDLEKIYDAISYLEQIGNFKVDLLLCCGDFQATRNGNDLNCMAVPLKYLQMCSFYKYYSGEKKAPLLTLFIGGNHEASNHLQELPYGGWVAPNIYYLGYGGVVNFGGIRIGGISGIYKPHDYLMGHHERPPYSNETKRSVYHVRNVEVFRLKQIKTPIDIFMSHDWPKGIEKFGNTDKLIKTKPFFRDDIENNKLGSPACEELLFALKPKYWFSAHLHCKFPAIVNHTNGKVIKTKFLALDKCLPRRKFLQIIDIDHDKTKSLELEYDLEWLTILHFTNHLTSIKKEMVILPNPDFKDTRWDFSPSEIEKEFIFNKLGGNLKVPLNFVQTVNCFIPKSNQSIVKPTMTLAPTTNPQTKAFANLLGVRDIFEEILELDPPPPHPATPLPSPAAARPRPPNHHNSSSQTININNKSTNNDDYDDNSCYYYNGDDDDDDGYNYGGGGNTNKSTNSFIESEEQNEEESDTSSLDISTTPGSWCKSSWDEDGGGGGSCLMTTSSPPPPPTTATHHPSSSSSGTTHRRGGGPAPLCLPPPKHHQHQFDNINLSPIKLFEQSSPTISERRRSCSPLSSSKEEEEEEELFFIDTDGGGGGLEGQQGQEKQEQSFSSLPSQQNQIVKKQFKRRNQIIYNSDMEEPNH